MEWNIKIEDLEERKEDYLLIDMRSAEAFMHGHIPGAINRLEEEILTEENLWKTLSEKEVVIYCGIGELSGELTRRLREKHIPAWNLEGGFKAWLIRQSDKPEGDILSREEIERYSRHLVLPQVGFEGQRKLKKAKVLVIGAGGLGSPVIMYLAAAGVGTIGICDYDKVDVSNLQRQIIHDSKRVGENKAESAKQRVSLINEETEVITYPTGMSPDNIMELVEGYDFILDGVDNFPTKFLINDACVIAGKPFCHAGVIGFEGQLMTYVPGKGPCYRCLFEDIPAGEQIPNCSQAGVLGAMVGVIGSLQALEALKYITGAGELLTGKMLVFDGLTMKSRLIKLGGSVASCRVCGNETEGKITNVKESRKEYEVRACEIRNKGEQ